ncbi:MAG: alpha/beta hydrolase [Alphaproteobacteria bacterium]
MSKIIIAVIVIYFCVLAAMYLLQRRLLFLPEKHILAPAEYGLEGFEESIGVASDGYDIQLWFKKAAPGMPTIMYFHGNAANLANRAGTFKSFTNKGFGILALSYRGYGKSTGTPTERGLYRDARAAITYLQFEFNVPMNHIILYGESLGSGVAVHMAKEYRPAGVVLEAPYTSVANRAAEIYFYIPVHLLIKDKFDSLSKIVGIKSPVLVIHGEKDSTIPASHGRAILAAAPEPKKGIFFADKGHNDFDRDVISAHVLDFAKEHGLIKQ